MRLRSKLGYFFSVNFIVAAFATSIVVAQELNSVLKSDTDDLRALIDLEPSAIDIEKTSGPISKAKPKPAKDTAISTAKQDTPSTAPQQTPVRSVLKKSRVVQDNQVKPAAFDDEQEQSLSNQLPNRLEQIDKPAPLPTPSSSVSISPPAKDAPTSPLNSNIDDALFNFGVLVADMQGGPIVRGVIVGSPAARAGIMSGDRIKSIGSQSTTNSQELGNSIRQQTGRSTYATVERNGRRRVYQVNMLKAASTRSPIASAVPRYRTTPENSTQSPTNRAQSRIAPTPATRWVPAPQPAATPVLAQRSRSTVLAPQPVPVTRSSILAKPSAPNRLDTQSLTDVPPPRPQPEPSSSEPQETLRQRVLGAIPQQIAPQQGTIVRGQGGVQVQRRRPVIGDGGRMIGNGRVINSFRRMFGR